MGKSQLFRTAFPVTTFVVLAAVATMVRPDVFAVEPPTIPNPGLNERGSASSLHHSDPPTKTGQSKKNASAVESVSPKPAQSSLDQQLMDSFQNDLLGGLDDLPELTLPPKQTDAGQGKNIPPRTGEHSEDKPRTLDQLDRKLLDQLGVGEDLGQESGQAPLLALSKKMRNVERWISQSDTSTKTQDLQGEIINDLATMIEIAKKQCGSCSSNSNSQCDKPGTPKPGATQSGGQSAAKSAPRESSDDLNPAPEAVTQQEDNDALLKEAWGHLPARIREQIRSGAGIQFLPEYERLIEQYYRRLAEER